MGTGPDLGVPRAELRLENRCGLSSGSGVDSGRLGRDPCECDEGSLSEVEPDATRVPLAGARLPLGLGGLSDLIFVEDDVLSRSCRREPEEATDSPLERRSLRAVSAARNASCLLLSPFRSVVMIARTWGR